VAGGGFLLETHSQSPVVVLLFYSFFVFLCLLYFVATNSFPIHYTQYMFDLLVLLHMFERHVHDDDVVQDDDAF